MDIRISHGDNGVVTVWQGDRLLAESVADYVEGRDQLAQRVLRARRLEAIPHIIDGAVKELLRTAGLPAEGLGPQAKRIEWCMGFEDGWNLCEVSIPQQPPLATMARPSGLVPCHSGPTVRGTCTFTLPYKLGYSWGEAFRRMVDATLEAHCE